MRPLSRIRSVSTKPMPSSPSRFAERHAAVLEDQLGGVRGAHAELVLLAPGAEARRPALDDERRDALLARRAVGHRHDHRGVGDAAVGDEVLRAVEHPVLAVAHRGRAHAAGVRARARLGEPPAAHLLAARERRQEAALLLLAAGQVDVGGAQAVVGGERERDAGVHARELLHHDRPVERPSARAAVLLRPAGPGHAELAEPREHLARELLLLVPLARVRGELASANSRTVLRSSCCSSLSSKSTVASAATAVARAVSWYTAVVMKRPLRRRLAARRWRRSRPWRRSGLGLGGPARALRGARSPKRNPGKTRLMLQREEEARAKGRRRADRARPGSRSRRSRAT